MTEPTCRATLMLIIVYGETRREWEGATRANLYGTAEMGSWADS